MHDVGEYRFDGDSRLLEPGMVFTIEPGLYVSPDDTQRRTRSGAASASASRTTCWSPRDGHRVLTDALARSGEEIEAFMAAESSVRVSERSAP